MGRNFLVVKYLLLILLFNCTVILSAQKTFYDERDGQEYTTITIDDQVWMAENVNYETPDSWTYNNKKKNGKIYGRLYTWYDAFDACPPGWHLPSDKDWEKLNYVLGSDTKYEERVKLNGLMLFNIRFGGFRNEHGKFFDIGNTAMFWTSKRLDINDAWKIYIDRGFDYTVQDYASKDIALSVRCIKNK